jgi:hypothetical protein
MNSSKCSSRGLYRWGGGTASCDPEAREGSIADGAMVVSGNRDLEMGGLDHCR